tara:strand:+ start:11243 stop:13948 length:2706 start_codon:yes stop_codon:yes gene_type:complete
MALVNCTIDQRSVLIAKDQANVGSVTLEIKPVVGHVVAASDFTNNTPANANINSITLSDSGTPYDVNNEVNVVVDFVNTVSFSDDTVLTIDIDGAATRVDLIPISVGGDFNHTLTSANVTQGSGSLATRDDLEGDNQYSVLDNPFETHVFATLTVTPTFSTRFFETEPTIRVTNSSYTGVDLSDQYIFKHVDTFNSDGFHIARTYTCSIIMPQVTRADDVIKITATSVAIPTKSTSIRGYQMNTNDVNNLRFNRVLTVIGDPDSEFKVQIKRKVSGTIDSTNGYYRWDGEFDTIATRFNNTNTNTSFASLDSNGNQVAHKISSSGVVRIVTIIPAETASNVSYEFDIIPETGTTIAANALGATDTGGNSDPDIIRFTISRIASVIFEVDAESEAVTMTNFTATPTYSNYLNQVLSQPPSGLSSDANSKGDTSTSGTSTAEYNFSIVIENTSHEFYLQDDSGNSVLSKELSSGGMGNAGLLITSGAATGLNHTAPFEMREGTVTATIGDYTPTVNNVDFTKAIIFGGGAVVNNDSGTKKIVPYATATAASTAASSISINPGTGATMPDDGSGNDTAKEIDLTEFERIALTGSGAFRVSNEDFNVVGRSSHFVIAYYTKPNRLLRTFRKIDEVPVLKIAVIRVRRGLKFAFDNKDALVVMPGIGNGYVSNALNTLPSSALDRKKVTLTGEKFYIENWGNANSKYTFQLDNIFSAIQSAGTSAPGSTVTLNPSIAFAVKEYTNSPSTLLNSNKYTVTSYPTSAQAAAGNLLQFQIKDITIDSSNGMTTTYNSTPTASAAVYVFSTASEFQTSGTTYTVTQLGALSSLPSSSSTLTIGTSGSPMVVSVDNYSTLPAGTNNLAMLVTILLNNTTAPVTGGSGSSGGGSGSGPGSGGSGSGGFYIQE